MAYEFWNSCVGMPGFSRSECASWVQAWGSIGALVGLWWATKKQLDTARRQKEIELREQRVSWGQLCFEVTEDVVRLLRDTERKFEEHRTHIGTERAEEALATVRSLESRSLPAELLAEMLVVKRELAFTVTAIRQHQAGHTLGHRSTKAAARATAVERVHQRLGNALARYRSELVKAVDA